MDRTENADHRGLAAMPEKIELQSSQRTLGDLRSGAMPWLAWACVCFEPRLTRISQMKFLLTEIIDPVAQASRAFTCLELVVQADMNNDESGMQEEMMTRRSANG